MATITITIYDKYFSLEKEKKIGNFTFLGRLFIIIFTFNIVYFLFFKYIFDYSILLLIGKFIDLGQGINYKIDLVIKMINITQIIFTLTYFFLYFKIFPIIIKKRCYDFNNDGKKISKIVIILLALSSFFEILQLLFHIFYTNIVKLIGGYYYYKSFLYIIDILLGLIYIFLAIIFIYLFGKKRKDSNLNIGKLHKSFVLTKK